MAKHFYAYLPVLMKQMYELISEDFEGWEAIVEPLFVRDVEDAEKAVIVQEIDRFLGEYVDDQHLLEQAWMMGARDFPGTSVREGLGAVRGIVQRSRVKLV